MLNREATKLVSSSSAVINAKHAQNLLFADGTGRENAALRTKLARQFSFNFDKIPLHIPLSDYLAMVEVVARQVYPGRNLNEAYELVGYNASYYGYFQSPAGQVLRVTARLVGAKLAAQQFLKAMRSILPSAQHELLEQNDKLTVYRLSEVAVPPALVKGWFRCGVEVVGNKLKVIKVTITNPDDVTYRIELE